MKSLLARIMNWKTTVLGTGVGAAAAAVVSYILSQAHCDFSQVSGAAVFAFVGSQLVGLLATDNGRSV